MTKNNLLPLNLQFFAEEEVESENTVEVADSSEVADGVEENTDGGEETTTEEVEEPTVQSAEDNSRFAAARRKAEQEFAERQRLEDAEYERRFKDYENPITHQPIRSRKDYFEALDAQEKLQFEQNLASGNLDADALNSYIEKQISNNPVVLQAQALMQANQQSQIENAINESVKEISRLDSSVKSIDDILNADNAQQIIGYVNNGMSLTDAYKLANFDSFMARTTAGAKQATLNNMKGTAHLNQTNGLNASGDEGVDIPESELGVWRKAFPDLSLKELRQKYNKVI